MKFSETIKPVSYILKDTSKIIQDIADNHKTIILTQNGEAKVVIQDIRVYEELKESLAMLKILALSEKSIKEGKVKPIDEVFNELENKIKKDEIP